MEELVILTDERDVECGTMPKIEAHEKGVLHRAFSVFIFNTAGELLLQQRAFNKYHSFGLWSNTCCSHPRPGESVPSAALRRLQEEMGIATSLTERFSFIYKAKLDNGLTEYEYDHVLTGICDDQPNPDIMEVAGWRYIGLDSLIDELRYYPRRFTEWFKICMAEHRNKIFQTTNF